MRKFAELLGFARLPNIFLFFFFVLFHLGAGEASANAVTLDCTVGTISDSLVTAASNGATVTDALTVTNASVGTAILLSYTATTGGNKSMQSSLVSGTATGPVPSGPISINGSAATGSQTWTRTSGANPLINITLTKSSGGAADSANWTATCTSPGITTNTTDNSATEGGDTGAFTVVLNTAPSANVTVTIGTSPQCTFASTPALPLTFTTSNWSAAQTVTVTAIDDALDDGNLACSPTVTSTSTDTNYNATGTSPTITAVDNDTAGLTVVESSGTTSVDEAGGAGLTDTFTVVLNAEPTATITVVVASADTTEGTVNTPLTFTTGNWNVAQTVTLTRVDDFIVDGNIGYNITLNPSGDTAYDLLSNSVVSATTTDDDTSGLTVVESGGTTSVDEAGGAGLTDTFTVVLNAEPTATITVVVTSGDTTEGTVNTPLTFTTGNWNVAQTVTLTRVDDFIVDGNIGYNITLNPSGDTAYDLLSNSTVSATTTDDDTSGLTVSTAAVTATEGGATGSFTVVLNSEPAAAVTVTIGTTAQCSFSTLVDFTSANWSTPQTVTVTAIDDALDDGNLACVPTIEAASTDPIYDPLSGTPPTITANDNDGPAGPTDEEIQNAFESQSHNFMVRRNDLITSHEPTLFRLFRRGDEDGELGGGNNGFNVVGDSGNMSGDFKIDARSISRALNAAAIGNAHITPTADLPSRSTFLNAWVEGEFGFFEDNSGQQNQAGDFFIGYAGVDARLNNRVLLGVMSQIDWMEDSTSNSTDSVNGTGWMVGPYLSSEPIDNVFFDLRAMWGRSDNSAIQDVMGSAFEGSFDTERWLMQALLSGKYQSGNIGITPEMSVIYMNEKQDGYSVTDGINTVAVAGQDVELGRLAAGMKFSYMTQMDEFAIEPFIGGRVLWDFVNPGMMNLDGSMSTREDIRGQISAGINFKGKNSILSFESVYDGLGTAGLEALSGKVLYSLQF